MTFIDGPPATARRHEAVRTYYKATAEVAAWLSALFKGAFPEEYERYADAFKAGRWMAFEEDPGPWLMRVLVWKLDVHMHVDGGDGGPTITMPCGFFTGGHMELPQLMARFA